MNCSLYILVLVQNGRQEEECWHQLSTLRSLMISWVYLMIKLMSWWINWKENGRTDLLISSMISLCVPWISYVVCLIITLSLHYIACLSSTNKQDEENNVTVLCDNTWVINIWSETTIVVPWFLLFTNIVPSVDSGLLAINFYTPSKFLSPCLMPQIASRGVKLHCKKIWVQNFKGKLWFGPAEKG